MGTPFSKVYNCFLGKVTDDLWELGEETIDDTLNDINNILIHAIPDFEFPRQVLSYSYNNHLDLKHEDLDDGYCFDVDLTNEEINILAILMMNVWLQRQIASIENTRMKYSGSDFKFTSQANHLSKLLILLKECQRQSIHMQRLYKRRKIDSNGKYISNWSIFNKI